LLPRIRVALLVAVVLAWFAPAASAQSTPTGVIAGTLSTQGGTVLLPGVLVLVRDATGQEAAQQISDESGQINFGGVAPGVYRVSASLDGFDSVERVVTVSPGDVVTLAIDLPIAALSERVDVVAASPVISTSGTLAASETVSNAQAQTLAPGGSVDSALRLIASVVNTRAGQSIDGGRPDQVGFQIGAATFVEPGTNLSRIRLPTDGIESVAVLANPYEAEFGRFSSGLVLVQTRRAGDKWKFGVNNLIPAFRTKRFTVANIQGIGSFNPSMEVGGPVADGRLFLEQTAQYHFDSTDVPSRPEDELKTAQSFGSLTRLDANLSRRHTMAVTGGYEQGEAHKVTLGTFTPIDATANTTNQIGYAMVTERSLLSEATFIESTLQLHGYRNGVSGQGTAPMELQPDTTLGNFFNRQHRDTATLQWVETASTSRKGPGGRHLIKFGIDVMTNAYHGTSDSAPVLVERSNGSLARRLDYQGPAAPQAHSSDVALFAQDRIQPSSRWYLEVGGRLDRDGIVGEVNASPRVGSALVLNREGTAVLRGGYGLFYERTPSVAGAFTAFEQATDTRFAADGVTPIGQPALIAHVVGDLQAARSAIWDLDYDYRFNPRWAVHAGLLDRRGDRQLILNPIGSDGIEQLLLSSDGRSNYLQEEVDVHMTRGTRVDVTTSYTHSQARENLNAFVNFYGAILDPIVGQDEYAAAAADTPNRLFVRGQAMPTTRWLLLGTFDVHTGLPYSVVNEDLDFVGPRNERRFPTYVRTEVGFDRRVALAHAHPWIGLRVANALGTFLPTDVQSNLASPNFGAFYNSEYREFRIHVRFEK
jgi:hypothetical protein